MSGLAWLAGLPWAFLARAAVVIGVYVAGHVAGAGGGTATVLRAERDAARRDLAVNSTMTEAGQEMGEKLAQAKAGRKGRVRDYVAKNKAARGCTLTDDDVRGMRNIVKQ